MDLAADHLGFVIGAYAITTIMLLGLVIYVLARDQLLRRELKRQGKTS